MLSIHLRSSGFECQHLGGDTSYGKIIEAVERAEHSRAPVERLADRLASYLVYLALAASGINFLVTRDVRSTIAVVIVAGACRVAAGTPLAILGAIGRAARLGAIIKGGLHLETLGRVDTVVLDKTGALTFGRPEVEAVMPLVGTSEADIIDAAAAAELRSEHPVGKAIVAYARARGRSISRSGVRAKTAVMSLFVLASLSGSSAKAARPLDTEDTTVIPFRHAEAEIGHVYQRDGTDQLSDTSTQFGVGAAPRLEASVQAHFDVLAPDHSPVRGGVADTLLQLKYSLFDERRWLPAGLVSLTLRVPTGSERRGLSTGEVETGFVACASKIVDSVNLIGNLGYTLTSPDRSLDYWTVDGAFEYALSRSWVAVGEAVSTIGTERAPTMVLLRAGFVYGLSLQAKLDAAVAFGATGPSPDLVITTGVTFSLF